MAEDFLVRTKDLYRKATIAGSIRRKQAIVHDIDFAVLPKGKDFLAWKAKVTKRVDELGGQVVTFGETISNFRYRGVQINLFICMSEDAWGVTEMWATGPKGHTIGMTIKARDKGLIINSKGLWTRDEPPKLVKTRTEHDVARILAWNYLPPEERGLGSRRGPTYH